MSTLHLHAPRLLAVCGALLFGAVLMPWASVSAGLFSASIAGSKTGDGKVELVLGALIVLFGLLAVLHRGWGVPALVIAVGAFALAAYDMTRVSTWADSSESGELIVSASVGIGLYLTAVFAGLAVWFGWLAAARRQPRLEPGLIMWPPPASQP